MMFFVFFFFWNLILLMTSEVVALSTNWQKILREHKRKEPLELIQSHDFRRRKRDENEKGAGAYGRGVGFYLGEPCVESCNKILYHLYCNKTTKRCQCEPNYPVVIENKVCAPEASLRSRCEHTQSCAARTKNSICKKNMCRCDEGYSEHYTTAGTIECAPNVTSRINNNADVTTVISVIFGLVAFTCLFCLALRLFGKQRIDPPAGTVEAVEEGRHEAIMMENLEEPPRRSSVASPRRYSRASLGSIEIQPSRRASYGMLVPPSGHGSRRASLASVHSPSSLRSNISFRSQTSFRSSHSSRDAVRRTASTPAADPHLASLLRSRSPNATPPTPRPSLASCVSILPIEPGGSTAKEN